MSCPSKRSHDVVDLRTLLREALRSHLGNPLAGGLHVVALHHVKQATDRLPGPLRVPVRTLLVAFSMVLGNLYGVELPTRVVLGRRFRMAHVGGIVIHPYTVFGDDCIIRHNVTVGATGRGPFEQDHATIGNRVELGAGAVIVGRLTIGDDAKIGPNAVVMTSVPPGAVVVAPASRTMSRLRPTAAHDSHAIDGVVAGS